MVFSYYFREPTLVFLTFAHEIVVFVKGNSGKEKYLRKIGVEIIVHDSLSLQTVFFVKYLL